MRQLQMRRRQSHLLYVPHFFILTVIETWIPVTSPPSIPIHPLPRHPAIRFKDTSERSVLLLPCAHFVEFYYSLGFGTTADSGDSWDCVDFLVVASLQTRGIWFIHASLISLLSCSRVCPLLRLLNPSQTRSAHYTSVTVTSWPNYHISKNAHLYMFTDVDSPSNAT